MSAMTAHEKRLQLAIRNHTINVLRECATQTHTDWEKYVKKSEAKAMKEFQDLINQARKEAAIEQVMRDEMTLGLELPITDEQQLIGWRNDTIAELKALKEGKQ